MFKKLKELYDYREMIISLVRKDLRGRLLFIHWFSHKFLGWGLKNTICS